MNGLVMISKNERNISFVNLFSWIWWPQSRLKLFPESQWSGSLNMLCRVSHRLIESHQHYTLALLNEIKRNNSLQSDGNLYFQEFFIPTVAHVSHLSMIIYDHSQMDVHVSRLSEDNIKTSWSQGKRIFHPVKHNSSFLFEQRQRIKNRTMDTNRDGTDGRMFRKI